MGAPAALRIGLHAGHFTVTGGAPAARMRIAGALRARVGDSIRVRAGGYSVPVAAAAQLQSLVEHEYVQWDEAALAVAAAQESRQRDQLRAWLEIADALADPEAAVGSVEFGVPLDRHQAEAAAAIAVPSGHGIALFDEQGTGKTISALAGFALLRRRADVERALVVAPKSVLDTWATDARRLLGPQTRVSLVAGTPKARRAAIRSQHDLLVANYEAVVAEKELLKLVLKARPGAYLLIVDESYFAKNAATKRSAAVAELRQLCRRAVVVCGTPAPNSPWDIVNQVNLADGGIAFGPLAKPRDRESERQRVVDGLTGALYLRRLKSDVLALPGQAHYRLAVEMEPEQRRLYERAARDLALEVRSVTDETFRRDLGRFLARRMALLQICSHPVAIDPFYMETPAKLLALDRLLIDLIDHRQQKVVVWSWFRTSLEAIARRYKQYGVARIDGSIASIEDRARAIQRFQTDENTRLFLGNAAAAGAGITLTAAHTAVYESLSNQAAHYMQSLDRLHRRGQVHDVSYLVLVCRDTVDEVEYDRLTRKQMSARELLGDPFTEEHSRRVFLSELEQGVLGGTSY